MRIAEIAQAGSGTVGAMRDGILRQQFLLTGNDDSPNNYNLNIGRTGDGGWGTPRHRHTFDQIRYVLEGNYSLSPKMEMTEGTIAYFPESVHYGPQERPEGVEMMVCQFGGASGNGFLSIARREAANEALKKKGEFKNGIFTYVDANGQKHNVDGSVACVEEALGKRLEFAKPRYSDVVLMDPANYDWIPTKTEGVFKKLMGVFTERELRIEFVRIEAGATFDTGLRESIQLLFQSKGTVKVNGQSYGRKTAYELLPNDEPLKIAALEDTLILSITMPKF